MNAADVPHDMRCILWLNLTITLGDMVSTKEYPWSQRRSLVHGWWTIRRRSSACFVLFCCSRRPP